MKMSERFAIFLTFFTSCLALGMLAGSLGSQHWVVSTATRDTNGKSSGHINFGLFRGTRRLNHGFGERVYGMNVFNVQYREKDFMIRELYVCTIASVCAALVFGSVGAMLALYNVASTPEEKVCHFPGTICGTFNFCDIYSVRIKILRDRRVLQKDILFYFNQLPDRTFHNFTNSSTDLPGLHKIC